MAVKKKSIAELGIAIPEWCLYAFINDPSDGELEQTIKHIIDNPDIAAVPTVVTDAAFSLICRQRDGSRIWNDMEIFSLSKKQRDTIERVIGKYLPVAEPVMDAIKNALTEKGYSHAE